MILYNTKNRVSLTWVGDFALESRFIDPCNLGKFSRDEARGEALNARMRVPNKELADFCPGPDSWFRIVPV